MNTEKTTTNEKSFRTAEDTEKLKRAGAEVAKHVERSTAAESNALKREAACAEDPSTDNLSKAKAARRDANDAANDLALVRQHQSKVDAEVRSAERGRIEAEIARRESALTVVADNETLEAAVDLAIRALELRRRVEGRTAQRLSEIKALNELRKLIGVESNDTPSAKALIDGAIVRLAEVGLSSQAQLGLRADDREFGPLWPQWRQGLGVREFLTGLEGFSVTGATGDGTPITIGTKRTDLVDEAKELLDRVKARRPTTSAGKALAGIAAASAVVAMGLLSAFTMVGG